MENIKTVDLMWNGEVWISFEMGIKKLVNKFEKNPRIFILSKETINLMGNEIRNRKINKIKNGRKFKM